jgi:hypothetical protein
LVHARSISEFGAVVIIAYYPATAPVEIYNLFLQSGLTRSAQPRHRPAAPPPGHHADGRMIVVGSGRQLRAQVALVPGEQAVADLAVGSQPDRSRAP